MSRKVYPIIPHFCIVKLGYTRIYLFFFIFFFYLKHRLCVLVKTACARRFYNLCFEQEYFKMPFFTAEKNPHILNVQVFVLTVRIEKCVTDSCFNT